MEDNDIKIFVSKSKRENDDSFALIDEMNEQRANGNLQKAKDMGVYLAERFLNTDEMKAALEGAVGSLDYPEKIIFQIKILVFFTAEVCINRLLPNALIKSTATNAIYDIIVDRAGDFYTTFSDGIEYSFYYLAIKQENYVCEIGKAFAMLCNKKNDEQFKQLGKDIFTVVANEIDAIIRRYEFEE